MNFIDYDSKEIIIPHAQRKLGKVIGFAVVIYILYVYSINSPLAGSLQLKSFWF